MENLITTILSEEMEKLGNRISEDLASTLVELDGNLKDIDNGTLIKIPMAAGYVTLSTYLNDCKSTCLRIRVWMTDEIEPENNDDFQAEIPEINQEMDTRKAD